MATFNFDSLPLYDVPYYYSNNGVSAMIMCDCADAGGFYVDNASTGDLFPFKNFTENFLAIDPDPIFISFFAGPPVYAITFNFGLPDYPVVTAFYYGNNGTYGTTTVVGVIPAGFTYPEGLMRIDLSGEPITTLIINGGGGFAIDNLTLYSPEPSSLLMLGSGVLGLAAALKRKLK
jgi:hypothetical protein